MKINNRRYIGCKTKLLDFIFETVNELYPVNEYSTFADIFAGTGVVAYKFAEQGYKTILNDTLYSNYVVYQALLGNGVLRNNLLSDTLVKLNNINAGQLQENYFSHIYAYKYFSLNDAKKIGYIRDYIEENKLHFSEREYYYLIASLLYASDKIANTVGHFESFLKREPTEQGVHLEMFELNNSIIPADIYNIDANELAGIIQPDIVYIDPPYNARQYVNFYHVLENLARWNKPTVFEGKSMKFKRNELKSDYCRKQAPQLFEDLIQKLRCKLIIVSYNNTYTAGSISSVNTIQEEEIIQILSQKGTVLKKEISYNAFNAGKTNLKNHKEYLFICKLQ